MAGRPLIARQQSQRVLGAAAWHWPASKQHGRPGNGFVAVAQPSNLFCNPQLRRRKKLQPQRGCTLDIKHLHNVPVHWISLPRSLAVMCPPVIAAAVYQAGSSFCLIQARASYAAVQKATAADQCRDHGRSGDDSAEIAGDGPRRREQGRACSTEIPGSGCANTTAASS